MFEDDKISYMLSMPKGITFVYIWIRFLTMAGKQNENGYIYLTKNIPYSDEMFAKKMNLSKKLLKDSLEIFQKLEMITINSDGLLKIKNWEKHQNVAGMDKIREDTRKRVSKYRNAKSPDGNVTCNVTVTQCNATEEEQNKNKNKNINTYSKHEAVGNVTNDGIGQHVDNVQPMSKMSKEEIETDIEIEKEIDKDKEIYKESTDAQNDLKNKFDYFWLLYPKKINRNEAENAFNGLVSKGINADDLIESLSKYKKEYQAEKAKFISKPDSYLIKRMWLGYVPRGAQNCPKCHGKGYTEKDNVVYECKCIHRYDKLKGEG